MTASFFSDLDRGVSEDKNESFFSDLSEPPSKLRSALSAILRGPLEAAEGINPFGVRGPIPPKLQKRLMEENLPILPEHEPIKRGSKVASYAALGPEGIVAKGIQTLGGTALGEVAKKAGYGETGQSIAETFGMGLPALGKGLVEKVVKAFTSTPELTKSGLPKLKATEAKYPGMAKVSPEREKHVIDKLNKEASKLSKETVEKHLPITKEIEKGVDFEKNYKIGFQNLKKAAEHANPEIDITPVSELMEQTIQKYRGLPKPNPEAMKVIQELRAFRKKPQTGLNSLLKIYRDNNKKMKHIYETSFLTGKQEEYVDFLTDMNRAIKSSFEKTLPENSAWVNQFKKLNKDYKSYQDARKTMARLKGILSGTPKPAEIERLATDARTQQKLTLSMGKEAAQEISQIAKDLKQARDAIRKLKKSEMNKFDYAFPLYYLIPYIGKFLGTAKALHAAGYFYGWILSTPARRFAYKEALNAFLKNDLDAYKKATLILKKELQEEQDH